MMGRRCMTAEEADDVISELGTAEVARRMGWGPAPHPKAIEIATLQGIIEEQRSIGVALAKSAEREEHPIRREDLARDAQGKAWRVKVLEEAMEAYAARSA